ncbi:MAG: hypothetical protein U1E29_09890 [Coriobacteriia bacterium]|nr:hypothetical protein [Coriobacteriia bacterium]
MDVRGESRLVTAFSVLGVAVTWAVAAVVVQLGADRLVLHLPFSIMPPRWWWYSPLPWPQSILTATIFAAASAAFVMLCVRSSVSARRVLIGMATGLAVLWVWALLENMGFLTYFGALQGLSFVRMNAAVRLSGVAGSVLGALLGTYGARERHQLPAAVAGST